MKVAILLVDLQNDFLRAPGLEPAAGRVIERAAGVLRSGRTHALPIVHVWTTVPPASGGLDRRMPHWKRAGNWGCVAGSHGHATPEVLAPRESESVVHKTFFSAFENGVLDGVLDEMQVDTLLFAGVHLHGCIRASVLDAYQRGYEIFVAEDAVASDDSLHAAITRRYLEARAARFVPADSFFASFNVRAPRAPDRKTAPLQLPAAIIAGEKIDDAELEYSSHASPRQSGHFLWDAPICRKSEVRLAATAAREAAREWRHAPHATRVQLLQRLGELLAGETESLARRMAVEVGKPVAQGRVEAQRTIALLGAVAGQEPDAGSLACGENSVLRRRPLGVVGIITPWNNPLAIPLGKIAPALFYGNAVVWKPAPAGAGMALSIMELLHRAGMPCGLVNLVNGDRATADAVMNDADVAAVTLSGSVAAGYAAQEICARRHIPLQAELGGNNAAIVWHDCDLESAAAQIAEAAFGFAGQRCTANRRVIVDARCHEAFLEYLLQATRRLAWGDPLEEQTQIGPLISTAARDRVAAVIERSKASGLAVSTPHEDECDAAELCQRGAYLAPTIIGCPDASHEVVQEETFGPVLVVQQAASWEQAMQLCNGVRQGLVAALFSDDEALHARFLEETQAGILKINQATASADAKAPFGGWKASGIGPPEHGVCNRDFYTRPQAVYHERIYHQSSGYHHHSSAASVSLRVGKATGDF